MSMIDPMIITAVIGALAVIFAAYIQRPSKKKTSSDESPSRVKQHINAGGNVNAAGRDVVINAVKDEDK